MPETPTNLPVPAATLRAGSVFDNVQLFEEAQRMAKVLAASALVPQTYRGQEGLANAIIALDMARRMGMPPLLVMQHMNVIHGRPSWSATFIIAAISSCGLFSPLRFKMEGDGDARSCHAHAVELSTGEILSGPKISIAMAKAEGWYGRTGSKWVTMPEQMLMYRAASFFGRIYAAHILSGLQSSDEVEDVPRAQVIELNPRAPAANPAGEPDEIERINAQARRPRRRRGAEEPAPLDVEIPPAGAAAAPAPIRDEDMF